MSTHPYSLPGKREGEKRNACLPKPPLHTEDKREKGEKGGEKAQPYLPFRRGEEKKKKIRKE